MSRQRRAGRVNTFNTYFGSSPKGGVAAKEPRANIAFTLETNLNVSANGLGYEMNSFEYCTKNMGQKKSN